MGSSSHVWEGHAELRQALEGLACAKGTSATRVKAVANAAFKYVKDYKRVVHDVEVFLWKADVEHRLAGLYAMDAIIRQSQLKYGTKDQFTKRFSLHLTNTISAIKSIPADSQQHVRHVVQEWQTRGFYTVSQVEEAGGHEYSINSSTNGSHSSSTQHDSNGQREETTPTASAGKLASLLSIIKKQKEMKEGQQHESGSILGDGPPQQHHHHHHHVQSHNPVPLLASPRASERIVSPSQRSSDNGYHHRDAYDKNDDRKRSAPPLLPEPPASAAIAGRARRDLDAGNSDEWYDSRNVKKPRGSRWGPPKPADANGGSGGDGMRPPAINTLTTPRHEERERASRYGGDDAPVSSRSPMQRPDAMVPPSSSSTRPGEPSPGGRVGYGFDRDASFHDNNRFAQAAAPNTIYGPPSATAAGRHEDHEMSAPHSARSSVGGPGEKIPGTSGEVCRKFIAGRCTFGDRCWHIHDQQQASKPIRPRMEMNDAKRKTVLCSNFPRGTCRFGDNCSFAHGEKDLDRSVQKLRGGLSQDPPPFADSSSNSSRWQTPAHPVGAIAPSPPPPHAAAMMSSANAFDQQRVPPQHPPQNRAFGTGMSPHPVFNEVQGDRGNSGASSMSHHHHHHHANAPVVVGGQPYQSNANATSNNNNNNNNIAVTSNLERTAPGAKDTFTGGPPGPRGLSRPRGPLGPPGSFVPVASYGYGGAPPPMAKMAPPPAPPVHRQLPRASVPPPSSAPMYPPPQQPAPAIKTMMKKHEASASNPVDEDDDADSAAPEFTLQYDDED